MGLQEYLAFSAGALERLEDFPVVHIVVGNEACDLDSAVSAITFAYYLHETSTAPVGTALFLPLLNIPRSDFPLRTEVTHFLGTFAITAAHLVFTDDLDLARVKGSTELKVTLVDHHVVSSTLREAGLEDSVVQIIDHRPKDGDLPDKCDSTLELVGSCATLVAEALIADETFSMDAATATLLYGTIVTDTINFSAAAMKTTAKDTEVSDRLGALIGDGVDKDSLYQEIKTAKFDLSGLTSEEILCKDAKLVKGDSLLVAISSVTMDINELMSRVDFEAGLKTFAGKKKVDAVVIMTLCCRDDDEGNVARQMAVFSPSRVYRQQMADVLSACQAPNLGLSPLQGGGHPEELLPFSQSNAAASRKLVLPVVKAFLAGESTPDEGQPEVYIQEVAGEEGFTSMSSIVEGQRGDNDATSDADITSEDLTSRGQSSEEEEEEGEQVPDREKVFDPLSSTELSSPDEKLLLAVGGPKVKVFDPLSSVHSSDSGATSPADANLNAAHTQLPAAREMNFDPAPPQVTEEGGSEGVVNFDPLGQLDGETETETTEEEESEDEDKEEAMFGGGLDDGGVVGGGMTGEGSTEVVVGEVAQPFPLPLPLLPSLGDSLSSPGIGSAENDPSRHNGLGEKEEEEDDNDDALEQDLLSMASPHDLLFPADSPLVLSAAPSGQGSGQGSGATSGQTSQLPSYPVTPPNSYMESQGVVERETHLPSFNSLEMVEKIAEKKAALGGGEGGGSAGENTPDTALSPFTPQNSYADTSLPTAFTKETQLPSFHSSDMVERIREKRWSMERDAHGAAVTEEMGGRGGGGREEEEEGAEGGVGFQPQRLDADRNPFTPHNSYVDSRLGSNQEGLPTMNTAEIADRIRRRQSQMSQDVGGAEEGEERGGGLSPGAADIPLTPDPTTYTPQNSLRHGGPESLSNIDSSQHWTDMNEVAERLSLTGSESSGSLSLEPRSIRASNRAHQHGFISPSLPEPPRRIVVTEETSPDTATAASGFPEDNSGDGFDEKEEEEEKERYEKEMGVEEDPAGNASSSGFRGGKEEEEEDDEDNEDSDDDEKRRMVALGGSEEQTEAEVTEAAIQKIAFELANEMIQKALETFPAQSVQELLPEEGATSTSAAGDLAPQHSISDDSSPINDPSDGELSPMLSSPERETADSALATSSESERFETHTAPSGVTASGSLADELASAMDRGPSRESESYEVETEYLSEMDPMHCVHSPDLTQSDAGREVVEGASFRKISGQENQTVQEEILEEIRQEARERDRAKMRQSSVAEEDDSDLSPQGSPEAMKRIVADTDDLDLDASLAGEGGKQVVHVTRDRELYAVALENANAENEDEETGKKKILTPSNSAHPLLDDSRAEEEEEEEEEKKKLHASAFLDSSLDDSRVEEEKKRMQGLDSSLDDSRRGGDEEEEREKKTIHASRFLDSSLDDSRVVSEDEEEKRIRASLLDSSLIEGSRREGGEKEKTKTSVLDSSLDNSRRGEGEGKEEEEKGKRKKAGNSVLEDCGPVEEAHQPLQHSYQSFAEAGPRDKTPSVARSASTASDASFVGSHKRQTSLKGVELRDEWQDDEMPKMIGQEAQALAEGAEPGGERKRVVPLAGLTGSGEDLENIPVLDSDSEIDSDMDNEQLEWENDTPVQTPTKPVTEATPTLPQSSATDERGEVVHWKMINIGDPEDFRLDMKVIEPYKKVLSHGGYYGDGLNAMIVFSACYLPSRDRKDYSYVMNHLFHYVIHTLDELVAEDYLIVYFHGATPRRQMPSFTWLKRCYQGIDHRLKKNLKALYLVHPTLWLKTVVLMTRPFISAKFSSKIQFVRTLGDLKELIPMEYVYIPEIVQRYDDRHFHPSSSSSHPPQ